MAIVETWNPVTQAWEASSAASLVAANITNVPSGNIAATNVQTAINELDTEKEPAITAGTSAQYYRGDKTMQTLNQAAVAGLTTASAPTFAGATLTRVSATDPGALLSVIEAVTTLQDGSASTGTNESFDNAYEAMKFTASASHTFGGISVRLKRTGTITNPAAVLYGAIYSDTAGSPNAAIGGTQGVLFGRLGTSYTEFRYGAGVALTSGTAYWLVLWYSGAPAGGTIEIDTTNSGTSEWAKSANGTAWTLENSKRGWFKIWGRCGIGGSFSSDSQSGVYGYSRTSQGVYGYSMMNIGVLGYSENSYGVSGQSVDSNGGYFLSTSSVGARGVSTSNFGIYGTSTSSYGGYFSSSSGTAIGSLSTSGLAFLFQVNPSSTNTVAEVGRFYRNTSSTAAAGIGASNTFYLEDASGNSEEGGRYGFAYTNATHGSELSDFLVYVRATAGAAPTEKMRLTNAGELQTPYALHSLNTLAVASLPAPPSGYNFRVIAADANITRVMLDSAAAGCSVTARRCNNTLASPTALAAGNNIMADACFGYGATGYSAASRGGMTVTAAEAWDDSKQGTYITFVTTLLASTTTAEKWRMTSEGELYGLKSYVTKEGGFAIRVVAGENLSRGNVVYVKQTSGADGKVWKNPIDSDMPVGVVYADAVADAEVVIITSGIAYVLPDSALTATRGYVIASSGTTAGLVKESASIPSATDHWRECGHWLDTGGGNGVITRAVVHFN